MSFKLQIKLNSVPEIFERQVTWRGSIYIRVTGGVDSFSGKILDRMATYNCAEFHILTAVPSSDMSSTDLSS